MKMPWDYALLPLEPTMIITVDDVAHSIWEALCTRLDEGPANFDELVHVAVEAGLGTGIVVRLLDQWLEKQRAAQFIELVGDKWQVRSGANVKICKECRYWHPKHRCPNCGEAPADWPIKPPSDTGEKHG